MNAGIRLQCGRQDTFEGKVCSAADMRHAGTPYWVNGAIAARRDSSFQTGASNHALRTHRLRSLSRLRWRVVLGVSHRKWMFVWRAVFPHPPRSIERVDLPPQAGEVN